MSESKAEKDRTCHCGNPAFINDAVEPGWTRGLCVYCDLVRCDAYPAACRNVSTPPGKGTTDA